MQFIKELQKLKEAHIDYGIEQELEKQGYRKLGAGVDQQAWLAKDGSILKIFGSNGTGASSESHEMFGAWKQFCQRHSNSHLVPHHIDFTSFRYEGEMYLQIKMERLFDLTNDIARNIEEFIAVAANSSLSKFKDWIEDQEDEDNHWRRDTKPILGAIEDIDEFWEIIQELAKIALDHDWQFDLHDGNLMLDDQGFLVIVDPWHVPE